MERLFSACRYTLSISYLYFIILGLGYEPTSAHLCATRLKDGVIPCFDDQSILQREPVKDEKECCQEKAGRVMFTLIPGGKWACSACEEVLAKHVWLPSPPCDKHKCDHIPQRYVWFEASIPNRKIECLGRSYKDMLHCPGNKTHCSNPEPTTDPVFCFKHRFRKFNSSSWGCPASSLDWELARDIKDCCVTRGRAGYAKHIDEWYIDKAKLHKYQPCAYNPSADITWSQWSECSSDSNCARRRSLQIPYLESMPNRWCVETFSVEESAADKRICRKNQTQQQTEMLVPGRGNGDTTILALAIVGLSTTFILIGVLCYICIRRRLKSRTRSSAATSNQHNVIFKRESDQTIDGYLVPTNKYTSPANRREPRALPEISEAIYERISYYSTSEPTAHVPISPVSDASYLELT